VNSQHAAHAADIKQLVMAFDEHVFHFAYLAKFAVVGSTDQRNDRF
jgi:hypothetical protein